MKAENGKLLAALSNETILKANMKGNLSKEEIDHVRKRIGQQLKEAREKKGLTQQGLADEMGIRQPTVASVERGEWAVSIDKLQLFCKYLGLEINLK